MRKRNKKHYFIVLKSLFSVIFISLTFGMLFMAYEVLKESHDISGYLIIISCMILLIMLLFYVLILTWFYNHKELKK